MTKIALIVPEKNNALSELSKFLGQENADIFIFPEGFIHSPDLDQALDIIKKSGSFVITGVKSFDEDGVREKVMVIDGGEVVGEYTKCVLTPSEKAKGKIPGEEIFCIDTRFGRIGVPICYEIHFSEVARIMSLDDSIMLVNLIGTGMYHELQYEQWNAIAKCRAIENEVYVLGCSHFAGEIPLAFVYSNTGEKQLEAKGEYGAFCIEVDLAQAGKKNINYAADRTPNLFSKLCEEKEM